MKMRKTFTKIQKLYLLLTAFVLTTLTPMMASASYGENAGRWLLDNIFWFGVVVIAVVLVGSLMKKAYVSAVIILVFGGIILFFIKSPDTILTIGQEIGNQIFK